MPFLLVEVEWVKGLSLFLIFYSIFGLFTLCKTRYTSPVSMIHVPASQLSSDFVMLVFFSFFMVEVLLILGSTFITC